MTTTLTYNGVQLLNCQTLTFRQSVEYESSGSDALYHNFTIRVASLIHVSQLATVLGMTGLSGSTAAEIERAAQGVMMHPGGVLDYSIGGISLVAATGKNGPLRDVNNGPTPKDLSIVHWGGTTTLRVEFEIVAAIVRCGGDQRPAAIAQGAQRGRDVLNNRWSLEDTRDQNFNTTRTWSGTLRVAHQDVTPNTFRALCIPPLQPGFARRSMRFLTEPDGLTFKYTISDEQQHASPPAPAVTWSGTHAETLSTNGALAHAEISVSLTGQANVKRADLITSAVRVIESRIGNIRRAFEENRIILDNAAIVDHLHEPTVEVRVRILRVPAKGAALIYNLESLNLGKHLDETDTPFPSYCHELFPVPTAYDEKTPIGVFAMYAQSPCNDVHGLPQSQSIAVLGQGQDRDNKRITPQVSVVPALPPDPPNSVAQDQIQAPYLSAVLHNNYEFSSGKTPLMRSVEGQNGETVSVVDLSPGICYATVYFKARRLGLMPITPKPEDIRDPNGIPMTLVGHTMQPVVERLLPDGRTREYSVEAKYRYALDRPPTSAEKLKVGTLPYDRQRKADNEFDGAKHFDQQARLN